MTTLTWFGRLLWQVAREIPPFVLARMDAFVKREQQRDKLIAVVGKDEAMLWLYTVSSAEAALTLIEAGYDLEQVMEIKEGLRS